MFSLSFATSCATCGFTTERVIVSPFTIARLVGIVLSTGAGKEARVGVGSAFGSTVAGAGFVTAGFLAVLPRACVCAGAVWEARQKIIVKIESRNFIGADSFKVGL